MGYDSKGWNKQGIHIDTKTKYDPRGYDRDGYDKNGFDEKGIHKSTGYYYDTEGFDVKGFDPEGYHRTGTYIEGYNEEGYDKNGYDRNGVSQEGINRITGELDERVRLAQEFIEFGKSIGEFAKHKQMPVEQMRRIIEEIRKSSIVREALDRVLERNSSRFINTVIKEKEQILSGTIKITDVRGIYNILKVCSPEERTKIEGELIKAMASHQISILQYKYILGIIGEVGNGLPQEIINKIEELKRSAGPLRKDLYQEIDRIKAYRMPYIANKSEMLGYKKSPSDKKITMVTITDEHRDMARRYLRATHEFICNKTMQAVLMKIIKGEIGPEQIVRAEKERQVRQLAEEARLLDELTEQAKNFIQGQQIKPEEVVSK